MKLNALLITRLLTVSAFYSTLKVVDREDSVAVAVVSAELSHCMVLGLVRWFRSCDSDLTCSSM